MTQHREASPESASGDVRPADHLAGFDCVACGHGAMAHYRNPGCRHYEVCRCSADPLCWCGVLSSKHEASA